MPLRTRTKVLPLSLSYTSMGDLGFLVYAYSIYFVFSMVIGWYFHNRMKIWKGSYYIISYINMSYKWSEHKWDLSSKELHFNQKQTPNQKERIFSTASRLWNARREGKSLRLWGQATAHHQCLATAVLPRAAPWKEENWRESDPPKVVKPQGMHEPLTSSSRCPLKSAWYYTVSAQ